MAAMLQFSELSGQNLAMSLNVSSDSSSANNGLSCSGLRLFVRLQRRQLGNDLREVLHLLLQICHDIHEVRLNCNI